jgi:hypothetical protein
MYPLRATVPHVVCVPRYATESRISLHRLVLTVVEDDNPGAALSLQTKPIRYWHPSVRGPAECRVFELIFVLRAVVAGPSPDSHTYDHVLNSFTGRRQGTPV